MFKGELCFLSFPLVCNITVYAFKRQSYKAQSPCQPEWISLTENTCFKCFVCSPASLSQCQNHIYVDILNAIPQHYITTTFCCKGGLGRSACSSWLSLSNSGSNWNSQTDTTVSVVTVVFTAPHEASGPDTWQLW